eukprot:TRINITY_DN824_c0_g1_i2.p1 TRINITY_DN824_c0_g1~~TRINITY_DN824_c0_g1_i2.p1  ORF type:complete len:379 (+),score=74.74 TRINITY_DN824_c0_g1_i2:51-1187(+)
MQRYQTGPHSFTEVTHEGALQGAGNSMCGMVVGLVLMFAASPALLWWNEGSAVRVAEELDHLKTNIQYLDPNNMNHNIAPGSAVYIQGHIEPTTCTDTVDNVAVSFQCVTAKRNTEMFQWIEHVHTREQPDGRGGKTKIKDYSYTQGWSSSRSSHQRSGHENPTQIPSTTISQGDVKLGAFMASSDITSELPMRTHRLQAKDVSDSSYLLGDQIYLGNRRQPQIGDHKISYVSFPGGLVSSIAILQHDGRLTRPAKQSVLPLVDEGAVTADELIEYALNKNTMLTWLCRFCGMVLMYIGMSLAISPLTKLVDYIPLVGGLINFVAGTIVLLSAILVSCVIIAVAWIAVRPLHATAALACIIGLMFVTRRPSGSSKRRE